MSHGTLAALSLISIKKYKKLRPRKPPRAIFYAPASPPVFADCKPPTGEIHEEIEEREDKETWYIDCY